MRLVPRAPRHHGRLLAAPRPAGRCLAQLLPTLLAHAPRQPGSAVRRRPPAVAGASPQPVQQHRVRVQPRPAQRLEHPEQQPRRPRPVRTARAEAGAAGDHRAPQHALAGVVLHRDPRIPHEPLQPLPVPQQRPQHPALRVHTGPLGPVPTELPAQPLPGLLQRLPLLQRPPEQLLHRLFQLLLTSPELRALRLQPLLPDFLPPPVQMKHLAEALDPLLRPGLQLRMPRARPHPVAPHMDPAVHGHDLQLRMLPDERLVGAVAVAHQVHHRLPAQMLQQLRGRACTAAGQDPHQRRVRGQADPQPGLGLLPRPIFLFGLRHLIEVDSHSHVLSSR